MKYNLNTILIIALSIAVGVVGSYFAFRGGDLDEVDQTESISRSRVIKTHVKGPVKKVTEISLVKKNGEHVVKIVETEQVRPGASVAASAAGDEVDEADLNSQQKAVLKELQNALDNNNLKQVRRALKKFTAQAKQGGLEGKVPVCMRSRAVAALGWFGKDAAVDLMAYVADANEEVSNDAFSQFEQALSDGDMSDMERAEILTAAMQAISDVDQVDSLLNQLNEMRNSVKAQTAKSILELGTDVAKVQMTEQLETYFDDEVADANTLDRWQAMNPDDPDDGETYGGSDAAKNQGSGDDQDAADVDDANIEE